MNRVGMFIVFLFVVALVTAGVLYALHSGNQGGTILPSGSGNATASGGAPSLVLNSPAGTGETTSDGVITFERPSDFGLAVNQQQVLIKAYIPPCDPLFTYCLYYANTSTYQGTNFESAGVRIEKRTDLTSSNSCLTTPPSGYTNFTPTSTTASDYALSEFTPIGNAGAGHYAAGTLYRLWYNGNGSCYEFETRIGETQFANYPSGTIRQFTDTDRNALRAELQGFLNAIRLPSGETVGFPG